MVIPLHNDNDETTFSHCKLLDGDDDKPVYLLDVVTKDLPMTLGTTLSETLSTFSAASHYDRSVVGGLRGEKGLEGFERELEGEFGGGWKKDLRTDLTSHSDVD